MEMVLDDIRSCIGETIPGQGLTNPPWDLNLCMGNRYLQKTLHAGNMVFEEIAKFSIPSQGGLQVRFTDVVLFNIHPRVLGRCFLYEVLTGL